MNQVCAVFTIRHVAPRESVMVNGEVEGRHRYYNPDPVLLDVQSPVYYMERCCRVQYSSHKCLDEHVGMNELMNIFIGAHDPCYVLNHRHVVVSNALRPKNKFR